MIMAKKLPRRLSLENEADLMRRFLKKVILPDDVSLDDIVDPDSGEVSIPDRGECWLWDTEKHATTRGGRGQFWLPRTLDAGDGGRYSVSNRAAYRFWIGGIPEEMMVLQKCGETACVYPRHLYTSSQSEDPRTAHDSDLPVCIDQAAQSKWGMIDTSGGPDACWEYQGALHPETRYAQARLHESTEKYGTTLHRTIWCGFWNIDIDEIPESIEIHHECENTACQNVSHMRAMYTGDHAKLHRRKLPDEVIHALRIEYQTTDVTASELSQRVGISPGQMNQILNDNALFDLSDRAPDGKWFNVWRGK